MKLRLLQCDLFLSKKNRRIFAFSGLVAVFCATASFGTLWSYSGAGAWVPPVQGALYEPYPTITVPLEAVVSESPAQITLKIYSAPDTAPGFTSTTVYDTDLSGTYNVFRKNPDGRSWGAAVGTVTVGSTIATWVDTNVTVGVLYEYGLMPTGSTTFVNGNVIAGIKADCTQARGRMAVVVAEDIVARLPKEYAQYKQDLVGDGWVVHEIIVARAGSYVANGTGPNDAQGVPTGPFPTNHVAIRNQLISLYNTYSNELKNVILIGQVPVVRSGVGYVGPDGHGNRSACGADAYYADMDGVWTDVGSNVVSYASDVSSAVALGKINVAGDSKFDADYMSQIQTPNSNLELGFGRIDFSNYIPAEYEAMRNYFNKLHRYKTASSDFLPGRRAVYRAAFGAITHAYMSSMPGVLGMTNMDFITSGDLPFAPSHYDADSQYTIANRPYLFYFKGDGGPSCSHEGRAVFWTGMQSNWGYWFETAANSGNASANTMLWRLAEDNFALSYTWSIALLSPDTSYLYHRMGMGGTAGDVMRASLSDRSSTNSLYTQADSPMFMNHMGDPALRIYMFAPPENLQVIPSGGNPLLSWTASVAPTNEPPVIGYHVYRADNADGPFTRLTAGYMTGTSYADTLVNAGRWFYQVKAVRLEPSGGGSFYNASLAAQQSIDLTSGPEALVISTNNVLPSANRYTGYKAELTAAGGTPVYTWSTNTNALPAGLTLSASGILSGTPLTNGTFIFTANVTDALGQTSQAQMSLIVSEEGVQTVSPEASGYGRKANPTVTWADTESTLQISGGPTYTYDSFLRFDLSGVRTNESFKRAKLVVFIDGLTPSNSAMVVKASLSDDAADGWSEETLCYNNQPADNPAVPVITATNLTTRNAPFVLDVSDLVSSTFANDPAKKLTVHLSSATPAGEGQSVRICTRYASEAVRPKLLVETLGYVEATPPPSSNELRITNVVNVADQSWSSDGTSIWISQPTASIGTVGTSTLRGYVMPFWIPDLEGKEIIGAELQMSLSSGVASWVKGIAHADVYGVRSHVSSPTTSFADFTNGTLLVDNWFSIYVGLEQVQTATNASLASWISGQVSTNGQKYVFLTVKPDTVEATANWYATFNTGDSASGKPTLVLTLSSPTNPPVARFSALPISGSVPLPVTFTDTSTGTITNRFWDFGDGATSNTAATSVAHTYASTGTYSVALTVNGPYGTDTNTQANLIAVSAPVPPTAVFSASPTSGVSPLAVTFTDTSTGSITNRYWNFGDGTTSNTTATSLGHTYSSTGTYTVALTVSGSSGANTNTQISVISVTAAPSSTNGTANIISVDITDVASNNTMLASSLAGAPGVRTNNWNTIKAASGTNSFTSGLKYSDGTAVAAPFKITYAGYQSSIGASGLTDDKLMFVGYAQDRESAGYYPMRVTLTNIPFSKYDIYIYADAAYQNGGGKISMVGQQDYWVKTAGAQIITATGSTYIQITNTTQASASNQVITTVTGTGNYVKYSNLTGTVQDFTVDALPVYGLSVQRLNLAGFQIVQIAEAPPVAGFSASPTSGVSPLTVTFTDTSIGSITNRYWDFGDGATTNTTATSVDHTYTAGTYTVSLIVRGAGGASTNTQSNVITASAPVVVPPPAPVMSISISGNKNIISWTTVQGSGYLYSVYYSTNLMKGFLPLPLQTNLPDTVQRLTNIINAPAVFYKIDAQ